MQEVTGEIRLGYSDPALNEIISVSPPQPVAFTRHFDQNEEFFIRLPSPVTVPALPIHHDVEEAHPDESYLASLRHLTRTLIANRIAVFDGLRYVFDPTEPLRPSFYDVHEHGDTAYLYLLRVDLSYRPNVHETVGAGSNDMAPAYRSDRLYVEADFIPLTDVVEDGVGEHHLLIEQLVSDTWIGETGRGYFVQGIWLDRDLTKFFSRLFLPPKKRTYPYYPFTCKYRSVCLSAIDLLPARRWEGIALLDSARRFLAPHIEDIQEALRADSFSTELSTFKRLKAQIDERWYEPWKTLRVKAYLNEQDMKEFVIEST